MSCFGAALGTLLSRLRVAILVRALLSTTSAAAPSPRRVGDERGLDAAQPRPYLNEPSFSRARWMADLFDEKMTGLVAEMKAAVAQERSAAEKLKRFIQLHLALVERNPELASVLIVELRQSAQFLKAADRQKLAAYVDVIAEVVRAGQESGELDRNISPPNVKRPVVGGVDEQARGWVLGGRRAALKKTAAEVAEW